jgi:hypothetical protein
MVDGVVVIGGTAAGTSGATGATVSVMVAPVVTSDVVTGPGGAGSGVWATLTSLNLTASAPIASTAVAPAVADNTLNCFDFTSDHPIRSLVVSNSSREVDGLPLHRYWVTEAVGGETPTRQPAVRTAYRPPYGPLGAQKKVPDFSETASELLILRSG